MSEQIFEKLKKLLSSQNANFRTVSHASAKTSAEVAVARGTELGQGAKALVCVVKGGGAKRYVLAVLPADCKADLQLIAQALGGTRASPAPMRSCDSPTAFLAAFRRLVFTRNWSLSPILAYLRAMPSLPLTRAC